MEERGAWADGLASGRIEAAVLLRGYERLLDAALAHLRLDEMLPELLQRTRQILGTDAAGVLFLEEDGLLHLRALVGIEGVDAGTVRVHPGAGFAGRIVASGKPLVLHDVQAGTVVQRFFVTAGYQTLMGVPLVVEGRVLGVLEVGSVDHRPFSDTDLRVLELVADRVAVALDRARLLEREQQRRAEAEQAAQFKGEVLSMASHDLKTPLTALKLQSALLGTDLPPEQRAKAAAVVQRNLRRLELLLDDFLDMARLEAGSFVLRAGPVDLAHLARDLAETFAGEAEERGLRLLVDLPGALPAAGDERRLVQVLSNLISNAIRYTPEGGSIAVSGRDAGGWVEAAVQDTGHGLTPRQMERLFQPFTQVQGVRDNRAGAGLGLWIAHQVVAQHGGELVAHSDGEDQGSTFTLRLRRAGPDGVAVRPREP
ncbi:MAG: hypothetical protein QOD77_1281 [Thermoplasmata archaeon]|jgi:signal transduction histidine kinase|nr:hypothetical protein [Thermoplasmata archaeon]